MIIHNMVITFFKARHVKRNKILRNKNLSKL